jgi:hypothetical protein
VLADLFPFGVFRIWFHDLQHLATGDSLNSHTSWIWNFDRAAHCSATTSPWSQHEVFTNATTLMKFSEYMMSEVFVRCIMKHIILCSRLSWVVSYMNGMQLYFFPDLWAMSCIYSGKVQSLLRYSTICADSLGREVHPSEPSHQCETHIHSTFGIMSFHVHMGLFTN